MKIRACASWLTIVALVMACDSTQVSVTGTGTGTDAGATCSDGTKNGPETDVDCGGDPCGRCAVGQACALPSDCVTGATCQSGVCTTPAKTCRDTTCDPNATCSETNGPVCRCAEGFFGDGTTCARCSDACPSGAYVSAACTSTADRQCTACTTIPDCAAGLTCSSAIDQRCGTCAANHYKPAGDATCPACSTCGTGKFASTACTATTDTVCGDCSAHCDACTSATTCTACAPGYALSGGKCSALGVGKNFPLIITRAGSGLVTKVASDGSISMPNPFANVGTSMDYGIPTVDLGTGEFYAPLVGVSKVVKIPGPTDVASFGSNLEGSAAGPDGNLYVTSFSDNRLYKVTLAGVVTPFITTGLSGPVGVAFDAAGNIYVSSFGGGNVKAFDPTGASLATWGTAGQVTGLSSPTGLAFSGGFLFVSEQNNARVRRIDSTGATTTQFVTLQAGSQANGLAFDAAGNLYIGDRSAGRVVKIAVGTFTPGATEPAAGISTFVSVAQACGLAFATQ